MRDNSFGGDHSPHSGSGAAQSCGISAAAAPPKVPRPAPQPGGAPRPPGVRSAPRLRAGVGVFWARCARIFRRLGSRPRNPKRAVEMTVRNCIAPYGSRIEHSASANESNLICFHAECNHVGISITLAGRARHPFRLIVTSLLTSWGEPITFSVLYSSFSGTPDIPKMHGLRIFRKKHHAWFPVWLQ
jgi:hypothetical protein